MCIPLRMLVPLSLRQDSLVLLSYCNRYRFVPQSSDCGLKIWGRINIDCSRREGPASLGAGPASRSSPGPFRGRSPPPVVLGESRHLPSHTPVAPRYVSFYFISSVLVVDLTVALQCPDFPATHLWHWPPLCQCVAF
jgi:hypothetical protein